MKDILYITAGEESGDLLGSGVIKHLRSRRPGLLIKGIGGGKMISEGLVPVMRTEELGFMGFFELVRHVRRIRKALKTIFRHILNDRPKAVLMIDFSEFHIKLARMIKKKLPDVRIIKYVSPQIWASRERRIRDIVRYYDCLCCILPFEPEIYRNDPIDCRYVGHPLLDKYSLELDQESFFEKFGISEEKNLISVFPGSREQEIKRHMPVLASFLKDLVKRDDVEAVICRSSNTKEESILRYGLPAEIKIVPSDYQWEILAYSAVCICKSGTTTLQTAVTATPSVVFYKVNPLSFMIAKKIIRIKYISLPNIIAGKQINPELVQNEFTSGNLLEETDRLLRNEDIYNLRKNELRSVRETLGEGGASEKVAIAVLDNLGY